MFSIFKLMFKATKWLIALNVIGIVVFIGYNANGVWVSSKLDQREQTEAIIVLGAAQFDGFPSPVYRNRLDKALELYEIGVSPLIITVGGKQPKDRFTEAEAGMKYLLSVNNKVSIDPVARGKNTLESLKYVRDEFPELRKVTLVSDPIHLWRSKIISKSLDFEVRLAANSSGPGTIFESNNFIKELAASVYFTINKYSSSFIDKSRIYNIKS